MRSATLVLLSFGLHSLHAVDDDYRGTGAVTSTGNGKQGFHTQGSLNVVVIPEPKAALLGGLGLLLILRRRRLR